MPPLPDGSLSRESDDMKTLLNSFEMAFVCGVVVGVGSIVFRLIDVAWRRLWPEPPAAPPPLHDADYRRRRLAAAHLPAD